MAELLQVQTVASGEQNVIIADQVQTAAGGTGVARQPLLCTNLHATVDDARLFERLDSESILPAIKETSKTKENTYVADKDDTRCHTTYTYITKDTISVPVEDDVKCKYALESISETNPAFSRVQTHDLPMDSNAEIKQTLCMSSKVSDGLGSNDVQPTEECEEEEDAEADLVMAAVAVEKALEDSELGLEHRHEAKDEKKPTFGNAESLRFQNNIFELVEELRIRRTMDAENELKMKQFMKEKHLLENKHEEAESRCETLRTEQTEQVAAVKKQFEAKISYLRDENARYAAKCDATDKEMKLLKDEIRASQLSKYTLEKRLRELEQKLQLQTTTKDSHLSRLAELDTLADLVNSQVTDLTLQQSRLEKNVIEAEKLNKKLQYVNAHQICIIDGYKTEIIQLQQDLMKTKVKLDQQPAILHNQHLEVQQKVKVLEDALNSQKDSVALITRQLGEKKSEHEKTVELLAAAHSLVAQQVDLNNHSKQVAKNYCDTVEKLNTRLTSLKADYDAKCKQLDIETQSHEKTVSEWKTQHQSLSCQLKTLQDEHQVLVKHQTELEGLNTQWARKNLTLVEEVKHLMDELNKPKSDVELQTEVDISDVALQTEVEVTAVALQTEVEVTETSVQTREVRTTDTAAQTDGQTSVMKSSQTEHVASVHQFIQTEDYNAEDRNKRRKNETDSLTQTEPCVSTEHAPVPRPPPKTRMPQLDITDHDGQETVLGQNATVADQRNSQQLEIDKCSSVVQTVVAALPVPPTGKILTTDQEHASTESHVGGDPRSGELSPYGRFKASLKSIGHNQKDAVVTPKGDTGDSKSGEVDTKRQRLSEAQSDKVDTTSHRYTFQFIDFPEPTVTPPVAQLPSAHPKGPDAQPSATKSPVGILHDPNVRRQRSTKRVTFIRHSNMQHQRRSPETQRNVGSFDQLQKHWENIQGAFDDVGPVGQLHPPDTNLKSEASFADNDDTVLFSDDEPAGFELGSQVEQIEHFLLSDRLKVNKGQSSELQ